MTTQATNANPVHEATHKYKAARPVTLEPLALTQQADQAVVQRAVANPRLARPSDILTLQRLVGNRAVTRLIQTKLTVGPAGDRYEQEADRVAEQVVGSQWSADRHRPTSAQPVQRQEEEEEVQTKPEPKAPCGLAASITPLIQREAAPEEEEVQTKPLPSTALRASVQREAAPEEEEIQTKPLLQRQADGSFEAGADIEQRLAVNKGSGIPLPPDLRAFMEPRFGADFGGVRVHTGGQAADLNRSLSAQAFTHGQDIYLGADKYDFGTTPGKRLLAHELTHVVQQTGVGSARRRSNAAQAQPSGVLQRVLAFKPGQLKGGLTFKAKAAGFFGKKSTWAQIQKTLQAYWADPKHPIALLMTLDNLADQWLMRHGMSPEPNDQLKQQSLVKLKAQILVEYGSISGPKAPAAATTPLVTGTTTAPSAGGATQPPKHAVPTKPLPPVPTKHVPPIKPLPPVPTKPTVPTATTAPGDLLNKALTELAPVGIAPQLLSQFPLADLQLLADAHRALTNRDTAGADSALVALKASADPTVQAVFGLVKSYLMRYHIGALAPEVQQIFDPHFKLSATTPLDQQALKTAKDYLEDPATITKAGPGLLGDAAQMAHATIADYNVLDPVEVLAIEAYTSDLYKEINTALRKALAPVSGMTKEQIAWAKAAVSGMHKLPLAPVREVYRHDGIFPGFLETHRPGAVVTDFAFRSSAQRQEGCSAGGAGHDVLSVAQQKTGRDVAGTAYFGAGEAEVLFAPGTKFKVDECADQVSGSNPSNPDWTPAPVKPKAESYWKKETRYKASIKHILFMSEV